VTDNYRYAVASSETRDGLFHRVGGSWGLLSCCQVLSGTDSEERRWLPFAGDLPLENGCHFRRRFVCKDIDFMPEGL
jgi:hypothetical protein